MYDEYNDRYQNPYGTGMKQEYNAYPISNNTNNGGGFSEPPKKKKGNFSKLIRTICFALVFGLVAGGAFQATNWIFGGTTRSSQNQTVGGNESGGGTSTTTVSNAGNEIITTDVTSVVSEVKPAIVAITCTSVQEVKNWFGGSASFPTESSGSGIIVGENDTELLIATNNHVVSGADELAVCFNDDEEAYSAAIKGTDSSMDLAVVAVSKDSLSAETRDSIRIASLGDSEALTVGEPAIAIGNALGYGQSVTTGVISALNREVTADSVTYEAIQTDAAINPGNSGGALINIAGEVIGINSVKISDSDVEGMGYSIPISDAIPIIENLMNQETKEEVPEKERGYLGIKGASVISDAAELYDMPTGVYISEVLDNSAAEAAGLQKGDIITRFDGSSVDSMEALQELLKYYRLGQEVEITVERSNSEAGGYAEIEVTLTLQGASS